MTAPHALEARIKMMSIVWLALTAGVIATGAVVYGLQTMGDVDIGALPPSAMLLLGPACMLVMIGGLFLGYRLEARIPPGADEDAKLQAYLTARVVSMAMLEGPALAVIVFSLVTGTPWWSIAGAAAGAWTLFLARPKREDVERLLRAPGPP